ncbi:uncharacterized protein LOC125475456 [Pyrus x bretschneideri]|uniref:uncharacterized protein LOC125475456 n=1 Tax=Pyrus x bretschneideri TaxID=225117 RepID=UPI00202F18DB|nr:uncharacterized protein LOC125475456 [Pyrus x bretschneideri]
MGYCERPSQHFLLPCPKTSLATLTRRTRNGVVYQFGGLLVMGDEKSASSIVMASRDREPRDRELLIPVADSGDFIFCVLCLVAGKMEDSREKENMHPIAAMTLNRLELDALPITGTEPEISSSASNRKQLRKPYYSMIIRNMIRNMILKMVLNDDISQFQCYKNFNIVVKSGKMMRKI